MSTLPGYLTAAPHTFLELDTQLEGALRQGDLALWELHGVEPAGDIDAAMTLMRIHDLHLAPIGLLSGAERWQHHPAVSEIKCRLESEYLIGIEALDAQQGWNLPTDTIAAFRALSALDRVPAIYEWLATEASDVELRQFIALEGGPDGGFDDLVAICQIGLDGEPKLELARNYWDEMGRGDRDGVHTTLHQRMSEALRVTPVARCRQPLQALQRSLLGSMLATNRWLQPEMIGALGLIELQAGPRCRQVVTALDRLGSASPSRPFYEEHANVDPRHGKSWLDNVIVPLADSNPEMATRMLRGARWRWLVNARFLDALKNGSGRLLDEGHRCLACLRHAWREHPSQAR